MSANHGIPKLQCRISTSVWVIRPAEHHYDEVGVEVGDGVHRGKCTATTADRLQHRPDVLAQGKQRGWRLVEGLNHDLA
jgi:hypothetical protein